MNFQQLEYTIALNQHKHFGKAAEACHVTQATLSGMIKKLEEELGYKIFDRRHQPVKVTEQGMQFLDIANGILKQKAKLYDLDNDDLALSGTLRMGVIPTIASSLLPRILPIIRVVYPDLRLEISEITTEEIQHLLIEDVIDIGILATPLQNNLIEEYILYYEAMMVYGIDQDQEYITSDLINDTKIWLLEEGHCFRDQSIDICDIKPKNISDEKIVFKGSSFDTLLSMTDNFGGITLIPELYYQSLAAERKERTKHFITPIPVREISIVAYRPMVKMKSINALSQLIKEHIVPLLITKDMKNKDLKIIGL